MPLGHACKTGGAEVGQDVGGEPAFPGQPVRNVHLGIVAQHQQRTHPQVRHRHRQVGNDVHALGLQVALGQPCQVFGLGQGIFARLLQYAGSSLQAQVQRNVGQPQQHDPRHHQGQGNAELLQGLHGCG